ncbi:MAG TPA: PA0069 family radical SAM protein [Chthoniobacteraceae bacterium]|jgi:DNA repair photolyase
MRPASSADDPAALAAPARGAKSNPKNRFEKLEVIIEPDDSWDEDDQPRPVRTQFFRDGTQSIIAWNDSPDIPFRAGVSPYRGCEHGCAYCFARPTHEYLGFSAGLDFETKIMVKERAPELLRREFSRKRWEPQVVALSGVTDVYQPIERQLRLTRACLKVFAEFRNPVAIITKNHLVTRDIDLLAELARWHAVSVAISVTTLNADLARVLEPRASPPSRRLAAIRELSAAGVPVRVLMAPIIPGLTEHEIPAVLRAVAEAGALGANYTLLRLPWAVAPLFEDWLERHVPGQKEKVLGRLQELRGGKLYDAQFGARLTGTGPLAEQIKMLFDVARRKAGFPPEGAGLQVAELSTRHFRVPTDQLSLFGD